MKELITQIDEMIETIEQEKQRTPLLDIAAGRLDAAKCRLQEHISECDKQQEARLAQIEAKTKELEKLQAAESKA